MKIPINRIYVLVLLVAGVYLTSQAAQSMELQPDSEIELAPYRLNYRIKIEDWDDLLFKKVAPQLTLKDTLNLSLVSKTSLQNFCRYCSLAEQEIGIKRQMMSLQSDDEHFSFKHEGYNRAPLFKPYEIFEMEREYRMAPEMEEIIEENKRRNFIQWGGIPICTPQLLNLINNGFIELMSLSMNQFVLKFGSSDTQRFEKLVHRLKDHLPEKSLIFHAVDCLSHDSFFLRKKDNVLSILEFFINKNGYENEKALYLFFKYLYGKDPNIQSLGRHNLYSQVKGAMGDFIRSQAIVHPIRLKLAAEAKGEKENRPQITLGDIIQLIRHDPGVLYDYVDRFMYSLRDFKWCRANLGEEGRDTLANYVIKRNFFKEKDINLNLLRLYQTKEKKYLYTKLLHRYLQIISTHIDEYIPYSCEWIISLHDKANLNFKQLQRWDLADHHEKQRQRIRQLEEIREKKQRVEYARISARIDREVWEKYKPKWDAYKRRNGIHNEQF